MGSTPSRRQLAIGAAVTFVVTSLFQFLTTYFPNDHFVHLSRAQQILLGEVPVRDFFDPGMILQYYVSALALLASGHSLLGEAIMVALFFGLGAALTFALSARVSGSLTIAIASTILVIVLPARSYGYPKAFLYVLALVAGWAYARRPTTRHVVSLVAITATAFLFRHDHGVYIGLFVVSLMALLHWRHPYTGLTMMGAYVGLIVVVLLPFVLFIQFTVGIPNYVRGPGIGQLPSVVSPYLNRLPFEFDRDAPLVNVAPPSDRRVSVRWALEIEDAGRRQREGTYGLTASVLVEDTTWSYIPSDDREDTIRRLVNDPAVQDTHGIDRRLAKIDIEERLWVRLQRQLPFLRMQLLPGVATRQNALAWLYYVFLLTPIVSTVVLTAGVRRGRIGHVEMAFAGAATVLTLIAFQKLVRGSPDSRLGDVTGLVCVIAAWTVAKWPGIFATGRRGPNWMATFAATTLWVVTVWAAGIDASLPRRLSSTGILGGPSGVVEQVFLMGEGLRRRPIESWDYQAGLGALSRYALACTVPTDRLLVTWFAPHVFFFAERPFAGGQVYLHPGWHASEADQRLTIDRLRRQRVPLVLSHAAFQARFEHSFPLVHDYVMKRYRLARESTFGGVSTYSVLVDSRITPTGRFEPLDLPCYR
jgi:hypothetical protein